MKKYIPAEIESKWQQKWEESNLYGSRLEQENKYYVLAEFAYPSGDLHMGHWFTFGGADIYARLKRMQGYNVFFPNGFDAFGLPAENAAIKRGIHPRDWTLSNIESMKRQFYSMGASFTFDHQVITCLPEYYAWNQWVFIKMFEKGIAYRGKSFSNWCPSCKTVLADEQVVAGVCDRCGTEVVKKEVDQWFLKITAYADRLLWKESEDPEQSRRVDWPKSVMEGQNNWIGRSAGILIMFDNIKVFTTRPDTLFGVSFIVISPEHGLLGGFVTSENQAKVQQYLEETKKKSELERKESKEKTGVFTGSYVKHPLSGKQIPVWIADYVLASYGTGAVMGVPAHDQRDFEFAKKFDLEIKQVIQPVIPADVIDSEANRLIAQTRRAGIQLNISGSELDPRVRGDDKMIKAYEEEGVLINSGEFNGLDSAVAREKISEYIVNNHLGEYQTQYHLHDWSVSRQRYWGTPIPMIHCDSPDGGCGIVPVPEKDLPVELPIITDFRPQGKPPLATAEEWVNVKCPKCGGAAKRDTDTMDGFFDNSWYFFRYLDPKNDKEIFDKALAEKWLPLEIYFGGAEHTLGHTLYSRFFTKFFQDIGLISFEEYAKKRVNHGIVLGPDGEKMSKSRGNVVNPDEEVKKYGADAIRIHMAFFMPYDGTGSWIPERVGGSYRFLQRVWALQDKLSADSLQLSDKDLNMMHKTIKKVTEDIEGIKFNTAIAALMEWLNHLSRKEKVSIQEYKTFILLLAPFAPHIAEELWFFGFAQDQQNWSVHQQSWPEFDSNLIQGDEIELGIQVNGKIRESLLISKDIVSDKEVVEKKALESPKVLKFLEGKQVIKVIYIPGKVINFVAI